METTIPYHPGLLLGRSVDMRKLQMGYMLIGEEVTPTTPQVNLTTAQFSFINSLKDVCDVLSIPPEYALKVKAGYVQSDQVKTCLGHLGRPNSFTVIFRVSFLHQKQYLPHNVIPVRSNPQESKTDGGDEKEVHSTESLIHDAVADSLPGSLGSSAKQHGTHWVQAVELGNELIAVMSISSPDEETRQKLHFKVCETLGSYHGLLNDSKVEALQKVASDIDKKLTKKHYSDVKLDIQYCTFQDLNRYPSSFSGLVKTIETFMDQCVGWTEKYKHGKTCELEAHSMQCHLGVDKEEKLSIFQKFSNFSKFGTESQTVEYHPAKRTYGDHEQSDVDGDDNSFVVLDSAESGYFYHLRVTLQSFEGDNDTDVASTLSSLALSQYPQGTYNLFERLFKLQVSCDKAAVKIQRFISSPRFAVDTRVQEGNQVLRTIQNVSMVVHDAVVGLDFVHIPPESTLEDISDPLDAVNLFIENVTSRLPPGSDLDLLMIGKTGHGKSSTGNSILGMNRFLSSADGESATSRSSVGWVEIDSRTIKVVDTPGVCDTKFSSDSESIDLAIQSISEAIANCPQGFHALLLIIRFGIRMTAEEKKAIGLLKCVLGEDIVRSHTICVITYGDNFEKEFCQKKITFEEWCKAQSGFLGDLFEECNYRCVLFNNKADDAKAKKSQLIQLVSKVDSLKAKGTRYTNAIFDFAQRERQKVIEEENVPQVNEDMMRDLQLVLEYLNTMMHNTCENDTYRAELTKLKEKVDNLSNRMTEVETGQIGSLVDKVFALAATIHEKMDEIADRPKPDSPNGNDRSAGSNGAGENNVASAEATSSNTVAKKDDFGKHMGELQEYYDKEVSPKTSMVNEKVTEKVKEEVKKESNCFPGSSTVILESGKIVALKELQVGDKILVRDDQGMLCYDTVYMFGHQEFDASGGFIVLATALQSVSVSRGHYVYCQKDGEEKCITAEEVRVGDSLLLATGDGFKAQPVEKISFDQKQGLFAPFTLSGTVVVDGFLMSCYIDVLQPKTCHTLLWPVRQLYRFSPGALALVNGPTSKYPIPQWAQAALKVM